MVNGRVFAGLEDGSVVSFETGDIDDDGWPMWGGGPGHNGSESPTPRTSGCRERSAEMTSEIDTTIISEREEDDVRYRNPRLF
jgi:hypothetical protein